MNDDAVESYLRTMDPAAMEAMLRRVGRVEAPVRCRASIHSNTSSTRTPVRSQYLSALRPLACPRNPRHRGSYAPRAAPRIYRHYTFSAFTSFSLVSDCVAFSLPISPNPSPRRHSAGNTPLALPPSHPDPPPIARDRCPIYICPRVVYGIRSRCKDISPSTVRCALCTTIVWSSRRASPAPSHLT